MADYSQTASAGQSTAESDCCYLRIPSILPGFIYDDETTEHTSESGREVYWFEGKLRMPEEELVCKCGCRMHRNQKSNVHLRHIPIGGAFTDICVEHYQLRCPKCHATKNQNIRFKAPGHRITNALYNRTRDLLAWGFTNKSVAMLTGLGQNTVKEIDKERLQELYTIDGKKLRKPERQARYLGIDEFLLHHGHRYATHISDFQDAFEEKCPHLEIVFDYFHVVKNFNDKVISEIRKDEQKRLREEGNEKAANLLKGSKFILTSSLEELRRKDKAAAEGKTFRKKGILFNIEEVMCKGGWEERYNVLLKENNLLLTAELVKEKIQHAYDVRTVEEMTEELKEIINICETNGNKHLLWFSKLIKTHFKGMVARAKYHISNAKLEGINNKIKTLRRQGYGYPDDEYFFLKIIDASRKEYVRNERSHRKCD